MAYNILKGKVEFTGENGNLENTVDLSSPQSIAGVKTFTDAITASAFYDGAGNEVAAPVITGLTTPLSGRVPYFNSTNSLSASGLLTYVTGVLSSQVYSGSGQGLTDLPGDKFQSSISASFIAFGNGLYSNSNQLAVTGGAGISASWGAGVHVREHTYGGLNFVDAKLIVDPTTLRDIGSAGQQLASSDKFIVADVASPDPASPAVKSLTVGTLTTYMQNNLSLGPITSYTNSTDNRVLTSVNSTTVNSEANLTFDGTTLNLTGELNATRITNPAATFTQNADNAFGSVLTLRNGRNGSAGVADDFCGGLNFNAQDSTSTNTQYSKISSKISSPTNTSEAGKMIFEVTTAGATATTYLTLDGGQAAITSSVTTRMESDLILDATLDIGTGIDSDAKIHVSGSDNSVLAIFETPSNPLVMAITGSGKVAVGGAHLDAKLNVSGSNSDKLISVKSDSANPAFYVSGSGDAYISGSLRAKQLHYTTHKWNSGGSQQIYLRIDTVGSDNGPTNNNKMVAPFAGKLTKVLWRFEGTGATGTTAFRFHKGVDGQQQLQASEVELAEVSAPFAADTTYTATFSGSIGFGSGDIIGVSIDPNFSPGISVATCVWEFDQNN
jgi:hypothetical protein